MLPRINKSLEWIKKIRTDIYEDTFLLYEQLFIQKFLIKINKRVDLKNEKANILRKRIDMY